MSEKTLEKVTIAADEAGQGYRLVLSWMTGGSGRRSEILADIFATRAAAAAAARADYGMTAEPADHAIDRRP